MAFADNPRVTAIEASRDRGFDYLDIYTSDNVQAKGLLLEDQLIIDLPGAEAARDLSLPKINSKRIKALSLKQVNGTLRLVLELKKDIDYEIVNVFGRNKSVIEICDRLD
ncbi:MAG: AMIN domain-containing protein, partial [Candidatus Margulisbacteria bacterium]|nr:AMIN domain-containing protein [Candidatus Margulisiibacteriota bacterium]